MSARRLCRGYDANVLSKIHCILRTHNSFPSHSRLFFPGTSPHRSYRLVLKAPEAPSIVTGAMPQYGQPQSILGHSGPEKNALGSMQAREKFGIISILNYTNFPRGWLKAVHYFHMMEYLLHGIKCGVQTPVAAAAAAAAAEVV